MNQYLKSLIGGGMLALGIQGQGLAGLITTDLTGALTPTDMVNSLLGGSTIAISNIVYAGENDASGLFSGGTGIIGFENGILLTTGKAGSVIGPNRSINTTTSRGLPGNAVLDALVFDPTDSRIRTGDASVLTFDFVPNGDFVQFDYVFGSEEYNNFVGPGNKFNDVFAFVVNGVNRAIVPGTVNTPVSINNVNCGFGGGLDGPAPGVGPNCDLFVDNAFTLPNVLNPPLVPTARNTELDGLTVLLTMVAPVNRGLTNTMLIGIADVFDTQLDSAVFVKGGSFSTCGEPGGPSCGVPEPGTLALLAVATAGLAWRRRQK